MDDQLYREIIIEHWKHPQNYGVLKKADIDLEDYNPLCGDIIRITAKVENGIIEKIQFTGEGCAISKAAGSILTEIVIGLSLYNIKKMTQEDFLKHLEVDLAPARLKCGLLAYSTLQKAIRSFK